MFLSPATYIRSKIAQSSMEVGNLKLLLSASRATTLSPFLGNNALRVKAHTDLRTLRKQDVPVQLIAQGSIIPHEATKTRTRVALGCSERRPDPTRNHDIGLAESSLALARVHCELKSRSYTRTDGTNLCRINLQSMVRFPCQGGRR